MKSDKLPKNNQPLKYRTGQGMSSCMYFQAYTFSSLLCSLSCPSQPISSTLKPSVTTKCRRWDICGPGPGQAPEVNSFNTELNSSTLKPSHKHYSLVEEHHHPPGDPVILDLACLHFPQDIICHLQIQSASQLFCKIFPSAWYCWSRGSQTWMTSFQPLEVFKSILSSFLSSTPF